MTTEDELIPCITSIPRFEVAFLSQGEIAMQPLTLKDIAKTIDMHESTISRCTNNKYVQTSRGVFEMKYFFSSELNTDFGNMVSSRAIKSMLEKIISGENKIKLNEKINWS